VAALAETFLTNGNSVAWSADPHYRSIISRFTPEEAEIGVGWGGVGWGGAGRLFDETIQSKLRWDLPRTKYAELLDLLDPKITRPAARDLVNALRSFRGTRSDLAKDTELKRLLARMG
jgi:hypothetical protein